MRFKALANIFLLVLCAATAAAQQTTTSMTSTGYFYPLGTNQFYTACPNNGGWYLGPDWTRGGCYTSGYYHIGFDMFNSSTVTNSPVFAAATGKVIYVDPNSSWSASGGTNNTAVFVSSTSASGTNYVIVYGHLLRSSVTLQPGDIVTAGTRVGLLGSWSPPHLHFGVWPNRSTLPPAPWGRDGMSNYPNGHGTADPVGWITGSGSSAKCQNGGSVRYRPGGGTPVHPQGTLFTVKDDPYNAQGTVYVLHNYQARPITSANVLYQLYGVGRGFDFRDVIQISRDEFYGYQLGSPVTSSLPGNGRNEPDGRLIKQWGGTEISIVTQNGYRRPFASADAFLNLGYQFCNVAGVSDYNSYPALSPITQ
jgi:murein DD-endopeptidase MepM/ murein hydrolase activator NlpD